MSTRLRQLGAPAAAALHTGRQRQSIEIVVTGRSDDHGGPEFLDRLCAAARHNHALLTDAGIAHTFTLVEWNPVPGRRLLSELVVERLPFWHRCWVVDPAWHAAISTNPRLQFMEFFAKNVAIRRTQADAVLTTNSDVFLSREVVARLAAAPLSDEHVYRAVRHDVDRQAPWRDGGEAVLANPAHHLRVNALAAPEYSNAAGDFLLLTTRTFTRLRGFNETVRFAKIHKDGQFCHRAWIEGLTIESMGPIWHLDHDGSYSNVGALQGSPDAPYGPEWDWRATYHNPEGWGLAAAIEEPTGGPIVWLRHPATHGPTLTILPAGAPAEVASRLGAATGQFVLLRAPHDMTAAERAGLEALLMSRPPRLAMFTGGLVELEGVGAVPAAGAPFVCARDIVEAVGDWPVHEPDPALAFWLAARGLAGPTRLDWPSTRPMPTQRPALREGQRLRACTAVDAGGVRLDVTAAALEWAAVTADARAWLERWIRTLDVPPDVAVAVCGPDWATPWLIEAARGCGLHVHALYTRDARERGAWRWGFRVRDLRSIGGFSGVLLAGVLDEGDRVRVQAAGFTGPVHVLIDRPVAGTLRAGPTELEMLLAAHRADLDRDDLVQATGRLEALTGLAGPAGWVHSYDAALACERRGGKDRAEHLFSRVVAADEADSALRDRARFHLGRLLFERGELQQARVHLALVLERVPDHRRAREYLTRIDAR